MRRKKRLLLLVAALAACAGFWVWRGQAPRFPRGIVIHHSASRIFDGARPIGAEDIDRWHAARGFGVLYQGQVYHIGYHYVIRADGVIEPGRPETCRGIHASRGNYCLGICLVGDFSSRDNPRGAKGPLRPTPRQMAALVRLCRDLLARHHLRVSSVRTHRQVDGDTECPGDRFPLRQLLSELRRPVP